MSLLRRGPVRLVMIASATNFLNSWKMVIVQACAIVLGVGIYFLMSQIDLTEAAKRWKWLLASASSCSCC